MQKVTGSLGPQVAALGGRHVLVAGEDCHKELGEGGVQGYHPSVVPRDNVRIQEGDALEGSLVGPLKEEARVRGYTELVHSHKVLLHHRLQNNKKPLLLHCVFGLGHGGHYIIFF